MYQQKDVVMFDRDANELQNASDPNKFHKQGKGCRFMAIVTAVITLLSLITAVIELTGYLPSLPFYAPVRLALVTQSKPSLSDPLSVNAASLQLDEGPTNHGSCQFKGGAYYAEVTQWDWAQRCVSAVSVHDFALQVQMKIVKGEAGGLLFRESPGKDSANNFYYFYISTNGWYGLIKSVYQSGNPQFKHVYQFFDPVIKTGLNAPNEITIMMIGDRIYLFANGKYLVKIVDSSLSEGQIGVAAGYNPSTVAFSNLKMWRL